MQVAQNKCIRFCLKLNSRHHIGVKEFKEITWVPTKERVAQRIAKKKFLNVGSRLHHSMWKGTSPF